MLECTLKLLQQATIAVAGLLVIYSTLADSSEAALQGQLNNTQSLDLPDPLTQNLDRPEPPTDLLVTRGGGKEPKVLGLHSPCRAEHEDYCVNGICSYPPDLNTPSCRCKPMFTGLRCEHVLLNTQGVSSPEEVIGISCGVLLLLICIAVLLYCFWRIRVSKSPLPFKSSSQHSPV